MKKITRRKDAASPAQSGPDLSALVVALQRQVVSLEEKIDMLIRRSQVRLPETKNVVYPLPASNQPHHQEAVRRPEPPRKEPPRQDAAPRGRIMYKAICADCNKECEVPFKPSGERPVYCKECFTKRRNEKRQARPQAETKMHIVIPPVQEQRVDKTKPIETKRPAAVKKSAAKKKTAPKKRKR